MSYWYPRKMLRPGVPGWLLFIPFAWPVLAFAFACWIVALAGWLVISVPVNLVRLLVYAVHHPTAE